MAKTQGYGVYLGFGDMNGIVSMERLRSKNNVLVYRRSALHLSIEICLRNIRRCSQDIRVQLVIMGEVV
jgi:hypothetical protein